MLNTIVGVQSVIAAPSPLAGYSLWLDASKTSSFTFSSGTIVSQWADQSGNAYNFAQATVAYQPDRQNNIQNGLPSVYFNSDTLTNNSWNWSTSAFTVFSVMKNRTPTSYDGFLSRYDIGALQLGYDNSDEYAISRIGQATSASNLTQTVSNQDVVVYKSAGISAGSISVQIYRNGTAASSAVTLGSLGNGSLNLLGSTREIADPMVGYISEVIIYPSQLSDTDRNKVELYLKTKWATP
jgi:hypothetical protein